jgi:hypothetical protein
MRKIQMNLKGVKGRPDLNQIWDNVDAKLHDKPVSAYGRCWIGQKCWRLRSMMDWSEATMPCIRSSTPVSYKRRVQETPMYIELGVVVR